MKTIPYTYLVKFTHPKTKESKYYYGSKTARGCNPITFWIDYFTSSNIILKLREEFGDSCFDFEIRKVFEGDDAVKRCRLWEMNVLRKLKVSANSKWLNLNENHAPPIMRGEKHPGYGKRPPEERIEKMKTSKRIKFLTDPEHRERFRTAMKNRDMTRVKSEEYRKLKSDQAKQQIAEGRRVMPRADGVHNGMYGRKHTPETIALYKEQRKGKYVGEKNSMFGKMHSDKVKAKLSEFRKGTTWIYHPDQMISKSIQKDDLFMYTSNGWKPGRIIKGVIRPAKI